MFTSNHRQHLLGAFQHFDAMLGEVLARIGAAPGNPLFHPYYDDADDVTRARALEAAVRTRDAMCAFMTKHDLDAQRPEISALHSAHAMLALMQVNALELDGPHLRGYGELSPEERDELDALSRELRARLGELDEALAKRTHE